MKALIQLASCKCGKDKETIEMILQLGVTSLILWPTLHENGWKEVHECGTCSSRKLFA